MTDFDDDYVEQVRAAEAAAQRSVTHEPDDQKGTDDLAKALHLRIEANLSQADGRHVTRVGGKDPRVRELEAPYSRRVTPEQKAAAAAPDPKPRARKRTAAKTAAKKAATTKKGSDS